MASSKGQVGFAPEMYKNVVFESRGGDLASGRAFTCVTPAVEPAVRRYRTKQPAQNVLKTIFDREVNTLPWASHTAKAPRHRRSCGFTPPYSPYSSEAANTIYNLLFCDNASAFWARSGEEPAPWQATLASAPPDLQALQTLAADGNQEGRVRYLAYQQLRHDGQSVPFRQLLGVIVEVPLPGGLDTLAAYSEGGVRYVNHSGRIAVVDGAPSMAPPERDNIRLTFLVSDGLYFGEGPMTVMQPDPVLGPHSTRKVTPITAVMSFSIVVVS